MTWLIACTSHAQGVFFSLSVGARDAVAALVAGASVVAFLAIVASDGNKRVERIGYVGLAAVLVLGGGVLVQGELKPISDWG